MNKLPLSNIKVKAKVDSIIDGLVRVESAYIDEMHDGVYVDRLMEKEYESLEWQRAKKAWDSDKSKDEDERSTIIKEIEERLKNNR
jgi:hypothetical protein